MTTTDHHDLSLRYCFDCPLPDCAGIESPRCPIRQHLGLRRKERIDGYLKLGELAARLGVATTTVSKWLRTGRVSDEGIRRVGRARLVPVSRLGEFERLCR